MRYSWSAFRPKTRSEELYADGAVFGADGSRLDDGDWAYALSLQQLVQIDYFHGGPRYFGRLLTFACKTFDDDLVYCYELFAVERPSCVMNAIRAIQRLYRVRRVRRYERSMHRFAVTLARYRTRNEQTRAESDRL